MCVFAQSNLDSLNYYSDLALKPKKPDDLFKAFEYFNTNYINAINQKNYNAAINLLYYKSSIEYKKGAYEDGERTAVNGLSYINKMKVTSYTKSLTKSFYNLLGLIYIEKFDKNKAIELYSKTIEFAESIEDTIKVYNNLSLVYKNHNEFINAKNELLKAHTLLTKTKDTLLKATIYDNLGYIYSKINKEKGVGLMQKALKIRALKQEKIKIFTSYNHLAKYFYNVNDTTQALTFALKNYALANELNSPSFKLSALSLLVDLKKYEFVEKFKFLSDSISKAEKKDLSRFMLVKYDYSEHKRKALEYELDKEKQEAKTIIAILIASFILLSSLFFYFILKSKHKKEKLQQVYDTESRISKKVHDDIANDIYQVMTSLQTNSSLNTTAKHDIEHIYEKARDISKQLGDIDLTNDYKTILNDLALRYNANGTNVILKGVSTIAWNKINTTKKTALYKVLQELLINMKKHSKASIVAISFESNTKKTLINYSDDGTGCHLKKGNGLLNVENRIKAINGTITFESKPNKGFKAKIAI
jgi:tetratricopeptide (TPR) repeat protein